MNLIQRKFITLFVCFLLFVSLLNMFVNSFRSSKFLLQNLQKNRLLSIRNIQISQPNSNIKSQSNQIPLPSELIHEKLQPFDREEILSKLSKHPLLYNNNLLSGLIVFYKPENWTSADACNHIKGIITKGVSVLTGNKKLKFRDISLGHGGTLDPMAKGVLVMATGKCTKLLSEFLKGDKRYQTIGMLGQSTDTFDRLGKVTESIDASHVTESMIEEHLAKFRGEIVQVPPVYSALKVNGVRMRDLAAKGIEVEPRPRNVTVYQLDLVKNEQFPTPPYFSLNISCSGGFYVRSLVHDLGKSLNTVSHMTELVRVKQGPFTLEHCLEFKDTNSFENIINNILANNQLVPIESYLAKYNKNQIDSTHSSNNPKGVYRYSRDKKLDSYYKIPNEYSHDQIDQHNNKNHEKEI